MGLKLDKPQYAFKITISLPSARFLAFILLIAITVLEVMWFAHATETYDVAHSGNIVKLYTEVENGDNKEDIRTVYKAVVRDEKSNELVAVRLKDIYYHTANEGDRYNWTETFEKYPVQSLFAGIGSFFLLLIWFGLFLWKVGD